MLLLVLTESPGDPISSIGIALCHGERSLPKSWPCPCSGQTDTAKQGRAIRSYRSAWPAHPGLNFSFFGKYGNLRALKENKGIFA